MNKPYHLDDYDTFTNEIYLQYRKVPNEAWSWTWYHDFQTEWENKRTPLHEYVADLDLDNFPRDWSE